MKTVPLSRGLEAMVDDADFDNVNQFKWTAIICSGGKNFYARHHIKIGSGWKYQSLHHFILDHLANKQRIDHKDGNGLNNQRSNLRPCTHAQNLRNRKHCNKWGYKGVYFVKSRISRPWMVQIGFNYQRKTIGYYATAEEAALVYNAKALELFGEFARLNLI